MAISVGSLSPTINWKTLAQQEFALPPKDEQRRIAEILWAADEMRQTKSLVLNTLVASRQTIVDSLLPATEVSSPTEKVTSLREICEMQNGRAFPSSDYSTTGVRLLRPGNLGADGYFDWGDEKTVSLAEDYVSGASEYLVEPGDVVINLTAQSLEEGFMGRVCLAREGDLALLNQRIGRFRCNPDLNPKFLFRYLQTSNFRKLVESSCEGSKIRHLYWRHIEHFKIALPSQEEQARVTRLLDTYDENIAHARRNLADSVHLVARLREDLVNAQG